MRGATARLLALDNPSLSASERAFALSAPPPAHERFLATPEGGRTILSARLTRAVGTGACLIHVDAGECAEILKAAALLHTDVAAMERRLGAHERAATHRAIAGWLLWHLPTQDDAFVREWVVVLSSSLRSQGSLAAAHQLGRLGLERLPKDESLLLWTARAGEALSTLCYEDDGTALPGDDCLEVPIAFDGPQPGRASAREAATPERGEILKETERLLTTLVKLAPDRAEVRLRIGRVLARRGREEKARRELRWVVANAGEPGQVALAHLLLGRLAETRGDAQGALEHAHSALAAAPGSQSARMALASSRLAIGDRAGAIALAASLPTAPEVTEDLWPAFLLGSPTRFADHRAALLARVKRP